MTGFPNSEEDLSGLDCLDGFPNSGKIECFEAHAASAQKLGVGGGDGGQRESADLAECKGKTQIFLHVLEGKGRGELFLFDHRAFETKHRVGGGPCIKNGEEIFGGEMVGLCEGDPFAKSGHHAAHDHVDDEFHGTALSDFAEIDGEFSDGLEGFFHLVVEGMIASGEEHKCRIFGRFFTAGYRGFEIACIFGANGFGDGMGGLWIDGGHLDVAFALAESFDHAVFSEGDGMGSFGIGDHRYGDIAGGGDISGAFCGLGTCFGERGHLFAVAVPYGKVEPSVKKVAGHRRPHNP